MAVENNTLMNLLCVAVGDNTLMNLLRVRVRVRKSSSLSANFNGQILFSHWDEKLAEVRK